MRARDCALALGLSGLATLSPLCAADKPVDDGLLEFLGSVDSEDTNWHDYLARTDIDKVARRAADARGNPGARSPPPSPPAAPAPTPRPDPGGPEPNGQVGHP